MSALLVSPVMAQESDDEDARELGTVEVTGSRLSRNDLEGPQPVTTITEQDIERGAYTTVFEALSSLAQFNGTIQDDQFAGFTQAASTLDLRALGPGRTLILLNGRRATDYPLAFNGQSNVVNLANIPTAMVDRIEILSSGASAIYGSDAVAGVVNVILKKDVDDLTVTLRANDTQDGGGETRRLQAVGGYSNKRFSLTYGIEHMDRQPVYAFERDFQDSFADNPTNSGIPLIDDPVNGVTNTRSFLVLDPFDGNGDGDSYVDPGQAACDGLGNLVDGTVDYSFRANRGFYCGTPNDVSQFTIRNAKRNTSLYSNASFELTESMSVFGSFIYTDSETRTDTGTRFWGLDTGVIAGTFINTTETDDLGVGGALEYWQRVFTPEEGGRGGNKDDIFDETVVDVTIGLEGILGDWDYEAAFSTSRYDLERYRRLIDASAANDFFLGPQQGSIDLGLGVQTQIFNAPRSRLYTALTPDEYQSITTTDFTTADSSNKQLSFIATNQSLFSLPAGDVGVAGTLEWATQEYAINLDQKLLDGEIFGFTGTGGGGERDRYALGLEARIPVIEGVTLTTAVRRDEYDDVTRVDDATTYNVGIEYRPLSSLLLRASAATSFRAPDMHYVFSDPSGFFTSVTDEYLCRRDEAGVSFPDCTFSGVNIEGVRQGNLDLEEEEGQSFTVGAVWEITKDISISVDYYDIELDNVVSDLSIANLLQVEADCRLGQTAGGVAVDINSGECQDTLGRITRNPVVPGPGNELISEAIDIVTTGSINTALLRTSGFDVNYQHRVRTERFGDFSLGVQYNLVTRSDDEEFEGDGIRNRLDDLQIFDWRSRVRGQLGWEYGDFNTQLTMLRTGSLPNWAETDRCCIQFIYNLSAGYRLMEERLTLGLFVNNLFDEAPPRDATYDVYPYYSGGNFDPYGREWSVQASYAFDNPF
ncbi:MAG: TonB-dependent receptor [Pseudomonadota bacterium]